MSLWSRVLRMLSPWRRETLNTSGMLEVDAGRLRYSVNGTTAWELPITDIRLIAESTNEDGPGADDYFFHFCDRRHWWYEASFYADGRESAFKQVESILGCSLNLTLVASTTFLSNVLWPAHLAGHRLFSNRDVWIDGRYGRYRGCEQSPTPEIEAFVAEFGQNADASIPHRDDEHNPRPED